MLRKFERLSEIYSGQLTSRQVHKQTKQKKLHSCLADKIIYQQISN